MLLQGASRQAAAAAVDRLEELLRRPDADPVVLGDELFAVTTLVTGEPALRRAVSDPSRSANDRAGMLDALLAGQVAPATRAVLGAVTRERWTRPRDLTDTLEELAVRATVAGVRTGAELDAIEDELFRFRQIVVGNPALRTALADTTGPAERRQQLLDTLVGAKVAPTTRRLIDQAVRQPRGRTLEIAIDDYSRVVAERRARLVAHVRVITDLTDSQRERLAAALARMYGHEVALNVEVDPSVVGGMSVRVGDEVVDATIASRLDEARRRLAG